VGRYPLPTSANAEFREPSPTTPGALPEPSTPGEGEKGRRGEGLSSDESDNDDPDLFAEFYDAYPRKEARRKAEQAYRAAIKRADHDAIMAGLAAFAFSDDRKFVPLPASWLNADRWADETSNVQQLRPDNPHAGMVRWFEMSPGSWQEAHPEGFYMGKRGQWLPVGQRPA